jgi:uncharacterized lipoprotein YajG
MSVISLVRNYLLSLVILGGIFFFVGCQDNLVQPTTSTATTDKQAIVDVINSDSLLTSFDTNYNEDGALTYLAKTNSEIKPFKVWQKMDLVNKVVDVTYSADTAYAHITKTFDGTLYIAGSLNLNSTEPDTVFKKTFTSVITRNAVLVKVPKEDTTKTRWVIKAVSLAEGGTPSSNINITKLSVFLPNGDTLSISSPNDYYLVRKWGWFWWRWHNVPVIEHNKDVRIQVELTSAYADTDFVSLTYGFSKFDGERCKKRFDLVSSTDNGGVYTKVYEQTFRSNYFPGFFHAVINAIPRQVLFDDSAAVESNTWGIPYYIKF